MLEKIANVVLIVSGIAVTGTLLARAIPANAVEARAPFEIGEKISNAESLGLAESPHTLILAVDPACGVCTSNMPFFKKIIAQSLDSKTHVVVVSKEPTEKTREYLAQHDLVDVKVTSQPLRDLRISAVPTLLLADQNGAFRKIWVGGLPPPEQEELLRQIRSDWK